MIDETVKWCQHKIRMDVIKWVLLRKKLMEYAITVLERLVGKRLREIVDIAEHTLFRCMREGNGRRGRERGKRH